MEEEWVDVKDYEGLYQISNCGRVKSLGRYVEHGKHKYFRKEIVLTPCIKRGHYFVNLNKNKKVFSPYIHILVAEHFISNPQRKTDVHHIDHNPINNHADNLMWVTKEEHNKLHPERYENKNKAVLQYTKDGQFVAEYKSAKEAEKLTGIPNSGICNCCKGKYGYKSAGGYKWKYK